jgi:penicillin-binding protein 2
MTALEDRAFNIHQRFFCPGYFRLSGRVFRCWERAGHGAIDFYHGFLNSCNVVFYTIGLQLDPDHIAKTASSFGLGLATGIDYPYEATGLIPTQRWKIRTYNQQWYPGDSLNMAIGQGFILATPLQMSLVVASLGNPSYHLMKPYLVSHIVDPEGKEVFAQRPEIAGTLPFSKENIATIIKLMTEVVSKGTGKNAYLLQFPVAGKTGTSEVYNQKKDHAWFVSFGPVAQPEIAMAVFVEEGGFGGVVAAGVSREIYAWWAKNRGMKKP